MKKTIMIIALITLSIFLMACTEQEKQINEQPNDEEPMFCAEYYEPVCGINGKTYSNTCFANIEKIRIAYQGECGQENALAEPKICNKEYNPVCGMDEVTYSNPCMAGNMQIKNEGVCENTDEQNLQIPNPASVYCEQQNGYIRFQETEEGTLGVCVKGQQECDEWELFRGECKFDDVPKENTKIYCTEEQKQAQICTMEYMPVCGSDGITHGNKCSACGQGIDYYIPGEC